MANYVSKHTGAQIDAAVEKVPVIEQNVAALTEEIAKLSIGLTDEQVKDCQTFAAQFKNVVGKAESFLFFADPHLCYADRLHGMFENYLNQIQAVYNATPTSMCVCAGDWLNNGNTRGNACWMLGVIDGAMKARFDKYINIVGNHDTNYQGYEYMQSGLDGTYDWDAMADCILSTDVIRNLWYRKQGNAYFEVDGDCTKFYVFDTGHDRPITMDDYRWQQVDWYANALLTDDPERSAILLHIADVSGVATPMVDEITKVADAYNNRQTIEVNGKSYDYANATGKMGFVLAGHKHVDVTYVYNNIPVIMSTNLRATDDRPTFDLVLIDWDAMLIHLVRVGDGENRSINLIDGSEIEKEESDNLFVLGSRSDYESINGKPVTDTKYSSFTVINDGLEASDIGNKTMTMINKEQHPCVAGERYSIQATMTSIDYPEKTPSCRGYVRIHDASGQLVTTGLAAPWQYLDAYKAFWLDQTKKVGVNTFDSTIQIPSGAATFMVGFLFDLQEDDNGRIRIDNISVKKVVD